MGHLRKDPGGHLAKVTGGHLRKCGDIACCGGETNFYMEATLADIDPCCLNQNLAGGQSSMQFDDADLPGPVQLEHDTDPCVWEGVSGQIAIKGWDEEDCPGAADFPDFVDPSNFRFTLERIAGNKWSLLVRHWSRTESGFDPTIRSVVFYGESEADDGDCTMADGANTVVINNTLECGGLHGGFDVGGENGTATIAWIDPDL